MSDYIALNNQQYNQIIDAYMKQAAVLFKSTVPKELMEIVCLYFPKFDLWDTKQSSTNLTIWSGNFIQRKEATPRECWYNAYGLEKIQPSECIKNHKELKSEMNIFKIWRIKFEKLSSSKCMFLGIIPQSKIELVDDFFCCKKLGYGLYGADNKTYHDYHYDLYGDWKTINLSWRENKTMDIIMFFKKGDAKHFCLGYRNRAYIHTAFDNLDVNMSYRFAAAFWDNEISVSFV